MGLEKNFCFFNFVECSSDPSTNFLQNHNPSTSRVLVLDIIFYSQHVQIEPGTHPEWVKQHVAPIINKLRGLLQKLPKKTCEGATIKLILGGSPPDELVTRLEHNRKIFVFTSSTFDGIVQDFLHNFFVRVSHQFLCHAHAAAVYHSWFPMNSSFVF